MTGGVFLVLDLCACFRTSRDLKTESVVLGFRETNWKPFEGDKSLSFFLSNKIWRFFVNTSFGFEEAGGAR